MTGRIRRFAQAVARPVIFAQYAALRAGLRSAVFPRDAASGAVPGDSPQRVLVIGEATAVGMGVLSHELGLAGHFSRQLARRTGRGVEWETRPFADLTIHTAAGTVRDRSLLAGVDVVLLMVGVGDSIRLTPQRTWRRLLCAAIDDLCRGLPDGARVLIPEVPPLHASVGIPAAWRAVAARHARLLNRVTAEVVESRADAQSVPFPGESVMHLGDPDAAQASRVYAAWSRAFVERLLGPARTAEA
ncbi:SGNH/GDSL hydrolase family protein [Clavibacter lycopersici]|uniref:SGNH/GDSL hydrolase family protein n=1 Tax=Clavibacter lycopersici TaxID=2301718 RepID=A0A399TA12_9MICO|nr:SGNH/GDSL hydrolase family protein [Clavibacter lycopersici]RIJ51057.1 SGNH/GDSL hydrolase family protein [Clavibacter lycopersici]RIJ60838.1 SGNH/GDSL hydrolase family protein [Clavibacter lycopersici]